MTSQHPAFPTAAKGGAAHPIAYEDRIKGRSGSRVTLCPPAAPASCVRVQRAAAGGPSEGVPVAGAVTSYMLPRGSAPGDTPRYSAAVPFPAGLPPPGIRSHPRLKAAEWLSGPPPQGCGERASLPPPDCPQPPSAAAASPPPGSHLLLWRSELVSPPSCLPETCGPPFGGSSSCPVCRAWGLSTSCLPQTG